MSPFMVNGVQFVSANLLVQIPAALRRSGICVVLCTITTSCLLADSLFGEDNGNCCDVETTGVPSLSVDWNFLSHFVVHY